MAHFPKPFFKKSRGAWYVEVDRKQVKLGSDREKAFKLYHELMARPRLQSVSSELLVSIIDLFLDWVQKNRAPDTYEWYRYRLQRLAKKYPEMTSLSLRPFHVEQWVEDYPGMATNSRRNYFRSIKRCLSWAVQQGHLDRNPISALELPGAVSREVYVPPDEFSQLLTFITDRGLRDLLQVTYLCGCRPQESLIVIAEYVDEKYSRWIFPISKAKGKQAPRIVYLTEPAMEIVSALKLEFPTGSLFRNSRGRPWTADAVNCAFDRIRTRMGKRKMNGEKISEKSIHDMVLTLSPTNKRNGIERTKTAAELRCEAKCKLARKKASE